MIVPLTRDKVAIIDDESWPLVKDYRWFLSTVRPKGKSYATAKGIGRMHRLIMDAKPGQKVDHINGDSLDNRLCNLRICTNSENLFNRGKQVNNTSGYKGVFRKRKSSWKAQIRVLGCDYYLRTCKDKAEAAHIYDQFARVLHGEFAKLNFED